MPFSGAVFAVFAFLAMMLWPAADVSAQDARQAETPAPWTFWGNEGAPLQLGAYGGISPYAPRYGLATVGFFHYFLLAIAGHKNAVVDFGLSLDLYGFTHQAEGEASHSFLPIGLNLRLWRGVLASQAHLASWNLGDAGTFADDRWTPGLRTTLSLPLPIHTRKQILELLVFPILGFDLWWTKKPGAARELAYHQFWLGVGFGAGARRP
ncbi:MAG: hypothetical protein C4523_01170 [Myxococcales bacterium]|nr:MAG: hypothetical protein C4523_01170 [Myxococcales bacterium]